jgi:hypothetical protein
MNHAAARVLILFLSVWFSAAAQQKTWQGSWSATAGNGSTVFGGTWDAALGDDPDTASGSWTLMDQSRATLADGTWAARKDQNVWRGLWQARGRSGRLYSGAWRAQSGLPDLSEVGPAETADGATCTNAAITLGTVNQSFQAVPYLRDILDDYHLDGSSLWHGRPVRLDKQLRFPPRPFV